MSEDNVMTVANCTFIHACTGDDKRTSERLQEQRVCLPDLVKAGWACPGNQFGKVPHLYVEAEKYLQGTGRRCHACLMEGIRGPQEIARLDELKTPVQSIHVGFRFPVYIEGEYSKNRRWCVLRWCGTAWHCNMEIYLHDRGWSKTRKGRNFQPDEIRKRVKEAGSEVRHGGLAAPLALYEGLTFTDGRNRHCILQQVTYRKIYVFHKGESPLPLKRGPNGRVYHKAMSLKVVRSALGPEWVD